MSIDIFKRDPRGRFIWKAQALEVWLPKLMEECYIGSAVETALGGIARFCDVQAAKHLRMASRACLGDLPWDVSDPNDYIRYANLWLRKAEIIRRVQAEIKGVKL